jgi:hypothetical protein
MPFTPEQMERVFATSIIDFAKANGFEIEKRDRRTVHVKDSGGLYFFNHGRGFYCFSTQKKGNLIDFAMEYLGKRTKTEAIESILQCAAYSSTQRITETNKNHPEPSEPFEAAEPHGEMLLPPKARNHAQAIAYLIKTRGIDKEIVYALLHQGKVFQSSETKTNPKTGEIQTYQNCCFVGYDKSGKARYCSMRSMNSKSSFKKDQENSDKTFGFTMEGTSRRIYEFEAPIDAMSHATLCKIYGIDWTKDHRIAEGGLSDKALRRYLENHPEIKEIVFCYDNDKDGKLPNGTPHNHGQIRAIQASKEFAALGYKTYIQTPKEKDFNQDLQVLRGVSELSFHHETTATNQLPTRSIAAIDRSPNKAETQSTAIEKLQLQKQKKEKPEEATKEESEKKPNEDPEEESWLEQ